MRLISEFTSKKALVVSMLILVSTITNARVFWNKVEATITNEGIVTLSWNVTEYNNKHFEVQHSVDGTKWEILGIVESKNSPQSMTDYTFTHKNKLSGKQYYRIKDTDIDVNASSFSPIKTVLLKTVNAGISVWPNPATNRILVQTNDNGVVYAKATIVNLTGRVMLERKLATDVTEIQINDLGAGTYIVKLETLAGTSISRKFIKQ